MHASRREFLKRAAALSASGVAAPLALNLAAISEATAFGATDYKALVCVFLYGGNDYANSVVTYDPDNHAQYAGLRGTTAFSRNELAGTVLNVSTERGGPLPGGRQYALAPQVSRLNAITQAMVVYPQLTPLVPLFDAGELAVVLNVGPILQPTTKADYLAGRNLPPKLFSHNDQQSIWQSLKPEGATSGWGGRLGDLAASSNGKSIFTCINTSGNAVLLAGQSVSQLQVSPRGAIQMAGLTQPLYGSAACSEALRKIVTAPGQHLFEREWTSVVRRSLQAQQDLGDALASVADVSTPFPANNPLAAQLKMVARLISARSSLGAARQVFMVSMGGFDTHNGLYSGHPLLLSRLGAALSAFQSALHELNVSDRVTTFTASDFGRALTVNGEGENAGSDHGWGGMHFVMGGAVKGGRLVGTPPEMALDGPDTVGLGRLLPATSVDEFAASLGSWLGASDSELLDLLPNWKNFVEPASASKPKLDLFA